MNRLTHLFPSITFLFALKIPENLRLYSGGKRNKTGKKRIKHINFEFLLTLEAAKLGLNWEQNTLYTKSKQIFGEKGYQCYQA